MTTISPSVHLRTNEALRDSTPPRSATIGTEHMGAGTGPPVATSPDADADDSASRAAKRGLIITFLAWVAVFGVGMSVPSQPFRDLVVTSCFALDSAPDSPDSGAPMTGGSASPTQTSSSENAAQAPAGSVKPPVKHRV